MDHGVFAWATISVAVGNSVSSANEKCSLHFAIYEYRKFRGAELVCEMRRSWDLMTSDDHDDDH
eukprot:6196544-Pleurochrysis_carterae.AAC.2